MAQSHEFIQNLGGESWQEGLRTLRETYGRGLGRWLSSHLGTSQRQIERYMAAAGITQGRQTRTPPPEKQGIIRRLAAAAVLRRSTQFDCGLVDVEYDGQAEGSRRVRSYQPANFDGAARALEAGDVAMAGELFDQEVMRAYGAPNLDVAEYDNADDIRLW